MEDHNGTDDKLLKKFGTMVVLCDKTYDAKKCNIIKLTHQCSLGRLEPRFYIVSLGFTRVHFIFLISGLKRIL